ncbi:MAG: hypothetical protein ABIT01_01050 [Thermoanaerobaculia bacterium]
MSELPIPVTRRSRRRIVLVLLVAALVLALALERSISHWRWSVKSMSDPERERVNRTPVPSTVAELSRIPAPQGFYPRHGRIRPYELTVYRVRARLIALHREFDRDYHLVITEPADHSYSMIVEIPAPDEGRAAGLEPAFKAMRKAIAAHEPIPPEGYPVEVTGVGFFDSTHWQPGASPTGFELHPVLEFTFLE